eukprot:gene10728-biopygen9391
MIHGGSRELNHWGLGSTNPIRDSREPRDAACLAEPPEPVDLAREQPRAGQLQRLHLPRVAEERLVGEQQLRDGRARGDAPQGRVARRNLKGSNWRNQLPIGASSSSSHTSQGGHHLHLATRPRAGTIFI